MRRPLMRRALVLGGSGAVGREVVRALMREDVATTFTWNTAEAVAEALESEGAAGERVDFMDTEALEAMLASHAGVDVLVGCAGAAPSGAFLEVGDEEQARLERVSVGAFRRAARALAPAMIEKGSGDLVAVGGLDRAQSLPVPAAWALPQGALSALTMALAKELGPHGVRANMVALGPLESGLATQLSAELLDGYQRFSALRRLGTPQEAAAAISWMALHNTYVSGKVLPVNGGI